MIKASALADAYLRVEHARIGNITDGCSSIETYLSTIPALSNYSLYRLLFLSTL